MIFPSYLPAAGITFCLSVSVIFESGAAPTHLVEQAPSEITSVAPGVYLVDFGQVAFGNLLLKPGPAAASPVVVHFGEAFANGRINRKPPGTVRYSTANATLAGTKPLVVAPPVDKRNTEQRTPNHPPAILTPKEWGVVTPFRWVEIEGWPGELRPENVRRQVAFASTWDDSAAAFRSSDELLNRIWELCRHSIKATTFAGVYVDGDRERIPYEADAYLNQLSHYATDNDIQMARDTFDHLMKNPTWPTEWAAHMIFMAHADYLRTGDAVWLKPRYQALKSKLLLERARADGLLVSSDAQTKRDDIVDWPSGERDGFVFKPVNTVVNAFHIRALKLMAELAAAVGERADASKYAAMERTARTAFQEKLFDPATGLYRDGEGTDHSSLHANLFPLAFDLVPPANRAGVTAWLGQRGMVCSVYAAQYLLEGLFSNGAGTRALDLIMAANDRSWKHMVESGTTITWEAWGQRYKPNQDWNHAWGAAPANLLPRFVLGVEPLAPGWTRIRVRPGPGNLQFAEGKVPTPKGPVTVAWKAGPPFQLSLTLPKGITAQVEIPAADGTRGLSVGGRPALARREGQRWILDQAITGTATIETR